ncbi:hypothetical protein CCR94_09060 [Rhodoblastus sphagnicola]|uniref:Uncharacterized protein n=1 Tax=Rhodoblastus sphagnicola TaxID=333368 RepID=A0A2S6NA02_9HYPH|nr:hypothetical protein [Rhodoblastus sphagnicola]MBB4198814.1 hypothetical protein [Rhodoblastus sphagnicola]PPQ31440.1 hypothetical protein CCR94_09060 [Rhodoblastus sphagnicola]
MTAAAPLTACSRPLAALRATSLENLFQSWRGRSGRRYICSVHTISDEPAFDPDRAVIAAVRQSFGAAEIAFVFRPEGEDFAVWAERARRSGATALHVHLLADTPEARGAVADDLRPAPIFAL